MGRLLGVFASTTAACSHYTIQLLLVILQPLMQILKLLLLMGYDIIQRLYHVFLKSQLALQLNHLHF